MSAKNYYLILGVADDATQDEIQRAFRRGAKQLHPDHYGPNSSPFLDLQEAYAVLGDPASRHAYDRRRRAIRPRRQDTMRHSAGPAPEPLIPYREPVHADDLSLRGSFQSFSRPLDEPYDRIRHSFGPARPELEPRYGLMVEVRLSLSEALRGGRVRLRLPAWIACPPCGGGGRIGRYECRRCQGAGRHAGELALTLSYPPGVAYGQVANLPLDQLGVENVYLNVLFRVHA